jgi:hypothetical protein
MSYDKTGGPAFPTDHSKDSTYTDIRGGMTLLDYFAGHALPVIIDGYRGEPVGGPSAIAGAAYDFATAMIAERERRLKESTNQE